MIPVTYCHPNVKKTAPRAGGGDSRHNHWTDNALTANTPENMIVLEAMLKRVRGEYRVQFAQEDMSGQGTGKYPPKKSWE